jgi:O-antigen ligase
VDRVTAARDRLRGVPVRPLIATLIVLVVTVAIAAYAARSARAEPMPLAVLGVLAVYLALACVRWPLLALGLFVALIPIEEVLLIEGFGTASKLLGVVFAVTYGVPRIGRLALGAMPPTAWAFVAWAVLSLGWALDPAVSWLEIPTLLQLFIIAVLVADVVVQRPSIVRPLFWIYSVSAAVTAAIGIEAYVSTGASDRIAALPGQNPAQFAGILLPALVFSFYQLMNGERRPLAGAIAAITTIGVVISGTRGAWVGAAVVIFQFVLPRFSAGRRIAAIVAMVAIGALVYQLPGVPRLLAERADTAISSGGAGRTDIWTVALKIFESNPGLGVGFANFPVAYTPEVIRATGVTSYSGQIVGKGPHDVVVGTLVELGPIGLLLLIGFLGPLIVRRGWGPDGAMVQAALASLATLALFLDILSNRKQVWLVIGVAAGLGYLARRTDKRASGLDAGPDAGPKAEIVRRAPRRRAAT